VSSSNPTSGEGRHLRLIRTGGTPGTGKAIQAAVVCILWLAIVWLLFASLVDTRSDDRTNAPGGKSQPLSRAPSRGR
jgi:hypothetical protein